MTDLDGDDLKADPNFLSDVIGTLPKENANKEDLVTRLFRSRTVPSLRTRPQMETADGNEQDSVVRGSPLY